MDSAEAAGPMHLTWSGLYDGSYVRAARPIAAALPSMASGVALPTVYYRVCALTAAHLAVVHTLHAATGTHSRSVGLANTVWYSTRFPTRLSTVQSGRTHRRALRAVRSECAHRLSTA